MENLNFLKQVLCPPGDGVYTVETAKEKKEGVQTALYGTNNPKDSWLKTLEELPKQNKVHLLGVPSDNGGGILRGANWGPLFIREGLQKKNITEYFDVGDIRVVPHLLHDSYLNEKTIEKVQTALYGEKNDLPVSPLSIAEAVVEKLLEQDKKVLSLGGDHSVSAALVPPFIKKYDNLGILHFDAHTDLLEERLGIDKCFATWAANVLPGLKSSQNIVQVGIRRSGKDRGHWEKKFGLTQYWADQVLKEGAQSISEEIVKHYKNLGITKLYVSFDIDAIDSEYASATGTPESDGLRPHEAAMIIEQVCKDFDVVGADMVEVAPFINHHGSKTRPSPEPETTLDVATQLTSKLLQVLQE